MMLVSFVASDGDFVYGWFVEKECEVVRAVDEVGDRIRSGDEYQLTIVAGWFEPSFSLESVLAFFAVEGDYRLSVVVVGGQFCSRLLPRHYGVH